MGLLLPARVAHDSIAEALERWKIRELMEGFPCHRDACEWSKVRSLELGRSGTEC